MQMASAVAEQRQHGPDLGRDALHQFRQGVFGGAVHFTKQLLPDRAEIVFVCISRWNHLDMSLFARCNAPPKRSVNQCTPYPRGALNRLTESDERTRDSLLLVGEFPFIRAAAADRRPEILVNEMRGRVARDQFAAMKIDRPKPVR